MINSKSLISCLIVCLIAVNVFAQHFDSTAWKYAKTITSGELESKLKIIASDEFQGRETGKAGQKIAMQYLIHEFKSYGISDYNDLNYKQSFPLIEQENSGISLEIGGEEFVLNQDFIFTPNIFENKTWNSEIVFVGYGVENSKQNDYKNIDVEGKGVFIWNGKLDKTDLDSTWNLQNRIKLAKEKGASVVFLYNEKLEESLEKYEHHFNKAKVDLAENLKEAVPVIQLTTKPTNKILAAGKMKVKALNKKGLKHHKINASKFNLKVEKPTSEMSSENVIAYIEGARYKDELVIITAHYDHLGIKDSVIYNGADDDGTGTASLLEIAQAFAQAAREGNPPQRSVLIMPVSGEEKGLLGSKYYTNHPIFPLENTVANLNIDMIGRYDENHKNDSNYIYLIGSDKLSADLHNVSEKVNKTYTHFNLDYTFNDENDPNRFYYRSDHYNFAKNNIPVIFYFSGVHEDYHKPTDTVEKIDFDKTERVARLVFLTAWQLVNGAKIELD